MVESCEGFVLRLLLIAAPGSVPQHGIHDQ